MNGLGALILVGGGTYSHNYESRCEPADHVEEDSDHFYETLENMDRSIFCEKCVEDLDKTCSHGCYEQLRTAVNGVMECGGGWKEDYCEDERKGWLEKIDQKPSGNFVRYDQVCFPIAIFAQSYNIQLLDKLVSSLITWPILHSCYASTLGLRRLLHQHANPKSHIPKPG